MSMKYVAFPAGAGMNRGQAARHHRDGGVPRRRGDEPDFELSHQTALERSPQARG